MYKIIKAIYLGGKVDPITQQRVLLSGLIVPFQDIRRMNKDQGETEVGGRYGVWTPSATPPGLILSFKKERLGLFHFIGWEYHWLGEGSAWRRFSGIRWKELLPSDLLDELCTATHAAMRRYITAKSLQIPYGLEHLFK